MLSGVIEPVSIIALITTGIPFVSALFKKVFKTDQLDENPQRGVHLLIPVVLGILSSGPYVYSQGQDWATSLAIGLGSGGAAASVCCIDKNLIQLAETITTLLGKKKAA
jgi:hypothetical protein